MKLPLKKIKLGHVDYIVRDFIEQEDPQYLGLHYFNIGEMALNLEKFPNKEEMIHTLLHEIVHAIWSNKRLPTDEEEYYVAAISQGLTEVFKRNPQLVKVINDHFTN